MSIRLSALLEPYKDWLVVQGFQPRSIRDYSERLSKILIFFEEIGVIEPKDLTGEVIAPFETWLLDQKYKPRTRASMITYLKSFSRFLSERGHIIFDLGEKLKFPKIIKQAKKIPSPNEIKTLIGSIQINDFYRQRDHLLISLLYFTGIRASEAVNLKVEDIDFRQRKIFIRGKGSHERFVYFPRSLTGEIKRFVDKHPFLFRGMKRREVSIRATKAFRKADLNYSGAHILRYTCATHLYEAGADERDIQVLLGHAELSSTYQYIQPRVDYLIDVHKRFHPFQRGFL